MSHIRLWTSAGIIAIIILISFALSVPHTSEFPRPAEQEKEIPVVPSVTLHDSYKKGVHTITGSLTAPTPCTVATATASLIGSASSTQTILMAISMPEDTGVCLQEPTRATFSATISAKASLPLSATVNGVAASTTPS